jgi:two-component system cell cycle sensor histidine kinase/response regulator CckA
MVEELSPYILLVEDEDAHVELMRRAFEDEGEPVKLVVARTLQDARARITEATPDLVIVDLLLPDGEGTELLPPANTEQAFPVVIMTSHGDEQTAVAVMKGGALDYVVKSELALAAMPRIAKRALREWGYIVEGQRANKEIRMLSAAVEQAAENIIITDTDGKIVYVNPAFEQTTGYSRAEVIGQKASILKSGKHDENFYRQLWRTISRGEVWHGRLVNRKKDGAFDIVDASITPVRDKHGQIVNYVSARRDITHELKLEERLRQAQKMEAVGQLAGGVAHDFNNILQAILGYAYMAKLSLEEGSQGQADLDQVINATNRATQLVRQLLAFSRRETLKPQNLDLNEVITNLLKMLRRLIGEHIELEIQTQSDLQPVFADLVQIEQVLMNLCVNARDAMPNGGKITLATQNYRVSQAEAESFPWTKEGDYILLSVTDTGVGIPPELQDRIFEPFFTTKEVGEGTGLGLATVYAIVKQHNGWINLVSELGQGSTFQIYFPAVARPVPSFLEQQPETAAVYGGTETILLAEDDDTLRELALTILQKAGYHVLEARDGEEAIRLFQQNVNTIELVVLDAVMPKQSGRAVYDCIRQDRAELPVLFSTGYGFNVLKNIHLPSDGSQLIRKPYSPRDLLKKVREVLDARPTRTAS